MAVEDVLVIDRVEIGMEKLPLQAIVRFGGDVRESAVEEIFVEGSQEKAAFRGRKESRCPGEFSKREEFAERERKDQDVFIPAAEFRRNFGAEKRGVAAGDCDRIFPGIVKRPDDAAPEREVLDLVEEEVAGRTACQLIERGEKAVRVLRSEVSEPEILEVDEENVLAGRPAGPQEIADQLVEIEGLAGAPRPDDGKNRPRRGEGGGGQSIFSGREGREVRAMEPFGYDVGQSAVFHKCLPR